MKRGQFFPKTIVLRFLTFHFCLQMDIIRTPKTLNKMASINLLRIRRRRTPMMNNSPAVNCKMADRNIQSGKQVFLMGSLITGLIGVIFCWETCPMRTWSTSRRRKSQRFWGSMAMSRQKQRCSKSSIKIIWTSILKDWTGKSRRDFLRISKSQVKITKCTRNR